MIVMNQRFRARKTSFSSWLCLLACLASMAACQAQDAVSTNMPTQQGEVVNLNMLAYNYTDNYIDSYQVDGIGGGNVFVSSLTSGGGGGTCCVRWIVGQSLPVTVHIRGQSSECIYTERVDGENFNHAKSFYSEKDVELTVPPSGNPQFFETHFYRDGHIEVAITDDYTPPRLKLRRTAQHGRPGAKPEARCTAAQMREGDSL